jgi:hypothetical protein
MTNKLDIETRLDRSLQNQVAAPRLDGRFDAAVWKRIAAEEQRARQPAVGSRSAAASGSARWMFITNVIGISVAALLMIFVGIKAFSGLNVSVGMPLPQVSPAAMKEVMALSAQGITLAALIFGLMFTPLGRRLKSIFT